jgi:actin-related protein
MLYNTIMSCDIDLRKTLFNQIIVAGATTQMQSFCKRLHTAVQDKARQGTKVTLIAPMNRDISCWIGGATVSSIKAF